MTLKIKDLLIIAAVVVVASMIASAIYDKFGKKLLTPKVALPKA